MSISASKIVPATQELLDIISANMRPSDIREVWASDHQTPKQAVDSSFEVSDFTSVVMFDDEPAVVFGLHMVNDELGVPWMLSSVKVLEGKREFVRYGRWVVNTMLDICPVLVNHVHSENKYSLTWLRYLGFTIFDPEPNKYGEMFHRFMRTRDV